MDERSFGEWLEDAYLAAGLTQDEFASTVDAGQSTVSSWINGHTLPRDRALRRIAASLDIDVREVFRRAGRRLGAAYVTSGERFAQMKETQAIYDELADLREVQRALAAVTKMLDEALRRRGLVVSPVKHEEEG